MAELRAARSFDAASAQVTRDDIAPLVPCDRTQTQKWVDAGFTHIALVQVDGRNQDEFLTWTLDLLPALRKL
jgi:hypothetical protein